MNNKFYFYALFSVLYLTSNAQTKEFSLKLEDNKSLIKSYFNNNENLYFYVAKPPSGVLRVYKNGELLCFDNNLNKKFSVKLNKRFNDGEHKFSKSSNYYLNIDEIIDENGNKREYNLGKYYSKLQKESKLNPIFKFYNGYAFTVIGPEIGRKNRKETYEGNDVKIFNLRNSDLKKETFTLQTPNIKTNQKNPSWVLGRSFDTSFYLTSKDIVEKNSHTDIYHLVENKYDGSIKSYTKLTVNLDNDKYFLFSLNDEDEIGPVDLTRSSYDPTGKGVRYGGVHINKKDNTFIVYGYYSKASGKQVRVGKVDGIYAFKFDKDGTLIWKNYYNFPKTKEGYLISRSLIYNQSGDKASFFSYLGKENIIHIVNTQTGKLEKTSSELDDFLSKKKILNGGFLKLRMVSAGYFSLYFKDKKINKNKINYKVLIAALLKPELKAFLLERTTKIDAIYNTFFNSQGDILLVESTKKNIRLYKF